MSYSTDSSSRGGELRFLGVFLGVAVTIALLGLGACHLVAVFDDSKIERTEEKTYLFPQQSNVKGWDLLVVVDTREGTDLAVIRDQVVGLVQRLADTQAGGDVIGVGGTGREDPIQQTAPQDNPIHVGFVSSDIGVGADVSTWGVEVSPPAGCDWLGGQGMLIHPPLARPEVGGPLHPFLVIHGGVVANFLDEAGQRYDIPIDVAVDAFWSSVQAIPSACPYQQPLAAATMALEYNLFNLGFFRADAALGVVVLTPGDDCSIADQYGFLVDYETNQPRVPSPFDCFAQGVTCDGPAALSDPGMKENCRDLDYGALQGGMPLGPMFMNPATDYAHGLQMLKGDRPVLLLSIAGPEGPVVVANEGGSPTVQATETCGPFVTHPGIRLKAFGESLQLPLYASMCGGDFTPLVEMSIDVYQNRSVLRCFPDHIIDQDENAIGVQAECDVEFVNQPGTANEEVLEILEPCSSGGMGSAFCWNLWEDTNCPAGLMLAVENVYGYMGEGVSVGEYVRARCLMEKK